MPLPLGHKPLFALLAAALTGVLPCTAALAQSSPPSPSSPAALSDAQARPVVRHYAQLVQAGYEDTLAAALALHQAVQALVAQPSAERLQAARRAWLQAREWYGQTEAFRFYAGPIDDEHGPEGRMNGWPLDESYIDSVAGKPDGGLINDPQFAITQAALIQANQKDGEENISAGWHAIEFLLWGQDQSATGPGNRPFRDFVDGQAPHADRRRQYLRVVTELLTDDLRGLVQAWAPARANYRAAFEQGGPESVRKIFIGLGSLSRGELAGERLEVALSTQNQEDEQSCFSDNTHRDVVADALGIQNVWLGRYRRRDGSVLQGPALRDLVAARQPALADKTSAQIAESLAWAERIPAPFDQAILHGAPGRSVIEHTVQSLTVQARLLAQAAAALGITRLTMSRH